MEYYDIRKGPVSRHHASPDHSFHTQSEMDSWTGDDLVTLTPDGICPTIPRGAMSDEQRETYDALVSAKVSDMRRRQMKLYQDISDMPELVSAFQHLLHHERTLLKEREREGNPKLYFLMDGKPAEPPSHEEVMENLDMQFADVSSQSFPTEEIDCDDNLYRLIGQTSYLAVGRHYAAVALWLYQKGRLDLLGEGWEKEGAEPTRVLVFSPDFIEKTPENKDAFDTLSRYIPVIYDERTGDGFDYDIDIRSSSNVIFSPCDIEVPDELAWAVSKMGNNIFISSLSTDYLYDTEPSYERTVTSWKLLEQDGIAFIMASVMFDERDTGGPVELAKVEEKTWERRNILDKIAKKIVIGEDNMSALAWKATKFSDEAFLRWNHLKGDEGNRLLFDALDMEASDEEVVSLVKQILEENEQYEDYELEDAWNAFARGTDLDIDAGSAGNISELADRFHMEIIASSHRGY